MKFEKLISLFTTPLRSLGKEGKFARQQLWVHARPVICFQILGEAQNFIAKIMRIAFIGVLFSLFEENKMMSLIKDHWILILIVFIVYSVLSRLLEGLRSFSKEKAGGVINREIFEMIWRRNKNIGIGMRLSSSFRQKLRAARRCDWYDLKNVGLWPIEVGAAFISTGTFLVALTWLNWKISLLFLTTATIVSGFVAHLSRWTRSKEIELEEQEEKANEYQPASLTIDSRILGICDLLFEKAIKLKASLLHAKLEFRKKAMIAVTLSTTLLFVVVAVQLYLMKEMLFSNVSFMKLGVTLSTMGAVIGTISHLMSTLFGDQNSMNDVRELLEFMELSDGDEARDNSPIPMGENDTIVCKDVWFHYPYISNAPSILKGIDLELRPGEAVVIVGTNGSGKTTLAMVLSNIHRPTQGTVLYGSTSIANHTTQSVLDKTLVIPQKGELRDLLLCESMFGVSDMSLLDKQRLDMALAMSGAKEVLDRLPNGIHTQIGTGFTGGTDQSGGERQRLRLAAFFYKALAKETRIVFADEPAQHIDPATRVILYAGLISMARDHGKIVVVVSHDAVLDDFDRVLVLDRGRIIGDHRGDNIPAAVARISQSLANDMH